MIKRMGDKEILVFENKMVRSLVSKEQIDKYEGEALLQKAYGNSISDFLAAFLQDRKLTKKEAERIEEAKKDDRDFSQLYSGGFGIEHCNLADSRNKARFQEIFTSFSMSSLGISTPSSFMPCYYSKACIFV